MLTALTILALLAPGALLLERVAARFAGIILAAVAAGVGVWFAASVNRIADGEVLRSSLPWLPDLGVLLSFRLDGLSLVFALLICFIGAAVLLYASSELRDHPRLGVFYAALIAFMASMLGLVLADNLILLFIFWELTSITSFLLIGFEHERESARRAALQALLVTGLGGLVLLAGLILVGVSAGGFEIESVLNASLHDHRLYVPAAILVLFGCFTKSAIVPFHFWLPNAMEAPSAVSALLHSSTMVKAGVYLVARLHPTMGGTLLWDDTLIILGGATMLIAAVLAARQSALKRILAYSTVSSLGVLMMLIGMGASKAAAVYLLAHAMFKGCLFLVAGCVSGQTGQKDPERLGGLVRLMPLTAVTAVIGALSMAGLFPLIGFVGKELLLKAGLAHPEWALVVTIATVLAGALTVMAAFLVGVRPFFGARGEISGHVRDPDWLQLSGPIVLAALGLIAGLAPALFAAPLVRGTIGAIEGGAFAGKVDLAIHRLIWPPSTATALSIVALLTGAALYWRRAIYRRLTAGTAGMRTMSADHVYDRALAGIQLLAARQTRLLQNGSLRSYVRVVLLAATAIGVLALLRSSNIARGLDRFLTDVTLLDALLAGVLVIGAIAVTQLRTALATVAGLGAIGYVIATVFVLYGAPDVAMTQFAVETLIVIIFVLVIYHLPRFRTLTGPLERGWDATVAGAFGVLITVLAFAGLSRGVEQPVSTIHAELSVPEAFGRNVVNVILVDFRALDTLVEIFVIGVAAVGVYTLLRVRASSATPGGVQP